MDIMELCELIDIPKKVKEHISHIISTLHFEDIREELEGLKHIDKWKESHERISEHLGEDESGMKILTCQLYCVCDTYAAYQELNIPDKIFIDTMKFFTRFLNSHKERHGSYRYIWAWWVVRQISMTEFRIGELEYEMKIENGQNIIDMHIPEDANLQTDKLSASYNQARQFFACYYPDFKDANMVCTTWLLAPSLKEVLPEDSKILMFQRAFSIKVTEKESLSFMDWVYGSRDIAIKDLPEKTSLQRKLKPYLIGGGTIEMGYGKLIDNPFDVS